MSLPDGVTTCLVTYGPITDTFGNLADSITVEVVADRTIVHGASGRTLFKNPVSVTADGGGVAQLPVPHTDQAGFRDQQQNALTGWYYTVRLTARFGNGIQTDTKTFQPLVGQTTVDADLLPSNGMVTPGVTAPTAVVTSVAGFTGEVTEADLGATFVRFVSGIASTARPAAGMVIWVQDEQPENMTGSDLWVVNGEVVPPGPDMAVVATDDFTGADSDTGLEGRTTTTGSKTWAKLYGFRTAINTNRAMIVGANGSSDAAAGIDVGAADYDVSAVWTAATPDSEQPEIIVRYVDASNFVMFGVSPFASGTYSLTLVSTGTLSELGRTSGVTPASGDAIRVVAVGTAYTCYVNDVEVLQITDATPDETAQIVGLRGRTASFTCFFDTFSVSA